MPDLALQKRLAADIKGVGVKRVKIPPEYVEEVAEALTREDVRKLIKDGKIIIEQARGISSGRLKERRRNRRRKGEGRREGSKKGKKTARAGKKEQWVARIRKIRTYLRYLRDNNIIDRKTYRKLYTESKAGVFKSLRDVKIRLQSMGIKVE
jgi:large subunit ribosomal protein L19e